ncbi:MAG: 16S rRNA (uracil(1498)-N(3))-methyltransferase [Rhizobiaceae bacterium]
MAIRDFKSQRVHVEADLKAGSTFEATRDQANYLLNVMRLSDGSHVLLFNGRDGEWRAEIQTLGRKKCKLKPIDKLRDQPDRPSLSYCFAPLKQARLDYMVQKAVEMGVGNLQPVITEHTQVRSINHKRIIANAIEAAEQCGIITLPEIRNPVNLADLAETLGQGTDLFFCDEEAPAVTDINMKVNNSANNLAVLIGPEGGFSPQERKLVRSWSNVRLLRLGPRILRADTAGVAALALVQAKYGDW